MPPSSFQLPLPTSIRPSLPIITIIININDNKEPRILPPSPHPNSITLNHFHPQSYPSISLLQHQTAIMGKTNKFNDRDHAAIADGTSLPHDHLPRFFAKSGYVDINPNKMKKNGAGKGGWGVDGEEVQDEPFSMLNARRRSNSSSYTAGLKDFKTKFETVEQDPVFEEDMGPLDDDDLSEAHRTNTDSSDGSIDENDKTKRD